MNRMKIDYKRLEALTVISDFTTTYPGEVLKEMLNTEGSKLLFEMKDNDISTFCIIYKGKIKALSTIDTTRVFYKFLTELNYYINKEYKNLEAFTMNKAIVKMVVKKSYWTSEYINGGYKLTFKR